MKRNSLPIMSPVIIFLSIIQIWISSCNSGTEKVRSTANVNSESAIAISARDLSGIKIGYSTPSLNAPFYVVLTQSVKKYTESYRYEVFFCRWPG